ncbi:MAG: hypothetical protein J2P34_01835 [Actinobacteria bacterium]|nr:hypothetical protein [Actinomycetota bacterium]
MLCALPAVIAALPVQQSALSARALRARMLASAGVPYQGYVSTAANLGLPDLPGVADVSGLLDGSTSQYVWYRSPARWRADNVTGTGENDAYQAGPVTYLWDFGRNLLTRVSGAQPIRLPRAADLLPPALARRLLDIAAATGRYARLPSRRVAGISAAGLRVTPAGEGTTIGAVDVWADPRTGLPVQVEVFGRGVSQPVLTSGFLELSQRRPALSVVTPHPAPGAGITSARLPDVSSVLSGDGDGDNDGTPFPGELGGRRQAALPGSPPGVAVYGSGLARFVLLPLPRSVNASVLNAAIGAGAGLLSIRGQTGALIRTPLLTVLLVRAGFRQTTFMFTGAVTPALLEQAATGLVSDLQQRQ